MRKTINKIKGLENKVIVIAGLVGASLGLTGCASMTQSRFYPKDYDNNPVGAYTSEMANKTGRAWEEKRFHAVPLNALGTGLAGINDFAIELPLRGITNSLAQIPYIGIPFEWLDYGLNTTMDSIPGGRDFNDSYGSIFSTRPYELLTNSYNRVYDRDENASEFRVGVEGTYKTGIKLLPLIAPALSGGGGGGSSGGEGGGGTNPGPAPFKKYL